MDLVTGSVQNYAWGSTTVIPAFLGVAPDGRPQAELWLGSHPASPARVGGDSLADRIAADPAGVVGAASVERFGPRLPYLMKVLAADHPLSLQAHPSRDAAEAGFAREDRAGIGRSAPTRIYRDDWPKPEMMLALGDMHALCGFAEPDQTHALFVELGVPAVTALVAPLRGGGPLQLAEVFARMLRLGDYQRDVVAQVVAAAAELLDNDVRVGDADLADFAHTAVELDEHYPGDPGILAALLMNRLRLSRFEALYLPAGNLHTYLHGSGVEIMANSDNVMRGGLTPKHVDVDELLAVVDFTPGRPNLVEEAIERPHVRRYRTPAPEFAMWRIDAAADDVVLPATDSGRIVLMIEGEAALTSDAESRRLARGQSVFAFPGEAVTVAGRGTMVVGAAGV